MAPLIPSTSRFAYFLAVVRFKKIAVIESRILGFLLSFRIISKFRGQKIDAKRSVLAFQLPEILPPLPLLADQTLNGLLASYSQ